MGNRTTEVAGLSLDGAGKTWPNISSVISSRAEIIGPSLDHLFHPQHNSAPMKTVARKSNRKPAASPRPQMTREIAEARAVGGGKGKFDGVAFLRTLKK